jgi:hypothetical protein
VTLRHARWYARAACVHERMKIIVTQLHHWNCEVFTACWHSSAEIWMQFA